MAKQIRTVAGAVLALAACLSLQACGQYGPRGDRGLPPAADAPYPNINGNANPPDGRRTLKTQAEQDRLKADLLARKRPQG